MENLTINGIKDSWLCYSESKGLAKCFEFYAENCATETIACLGFNENSGNIYIALENGVTIASCVGQDVVFYRTNSDGEELEFESYEDALNYQEEEEEEEEN